MAIKYLGMAVFAAFLIGACTTQKAAGPGSNEESAARAEEAAKRAEEAASKAETAAEKSEVIFHKGLEK